MRWEMATKTGKKFWEIHVTKNETIVRFGKVGTDGQTRSKEHASPSAAKTAKARMIAEKEKKGYLRKKAATKKKAAKKTSVKKSATKKKTAKKKSTKKASTKRTAARKKTATKKKSLTATKTSKKKDGSISYEVVYSENVGPIYTSCVTDDGIWLAGENQGKGALLFGAGDPLKFKKFKKRPRVGAIGTWGVLETSDGELLFAGGFGVFRSEKKVTQWKEVNDWARIQAFHRDKKGTIWAGGGNALLFSTNEGKTWKPVLPGVSSVFCFLETERHLIALGEQATLIEKRKVVKSTALPERPNDKLTRAVYDVAQSPDGTFFAVGRSGTLLRSKDGLSWSDLDFPKKADLFCIEWCGDRFLIGGHAVLFEADENGGALQRVPLKGKNLKVETIRAFDNKIVIAGEVAMPKGKGAGKGFVFATEKSVADSNDADGAFAPDYSEHLKAAKKETAVGAVERYQKFTNAVVAYAQSSASTDIGDMKRWNARCPVDFFSKPLKMKEIRAAEKRLGVALPPSYVKFVTSEGLFSFGKDSAEGRLMKPSELKRLDRWVSEELGYDIERDLDSNVVPFIDKAIPFAFINADGEYHAFRTDYQCNGEFFVDSVYDDLDCGPLKKHPAWKKSFDAFVSGWVTKKIQTVCEELEEGMYY